MPRYAGRGCCGCGSCAHPCLLCAFQDLRQKLAIPPFTNIPPGGPDNCPSYHGTIYLDPIGEQDWGWDNVRNIWIECDSGFGVFTGVGRDVKFCTWALTGAPLDWYAGFGCDSVNGGFNFTAGQFQAGGTFAVVWQKNAATKTDMCAGSALSLPLVFDGFGGLLCAPSDPITADLVV